MEINEQIDFTKCTYLSYPIQTGKCLYLEMRQEGKSNITDFCSENAEKAKSIRDYNKKKIFNFVQDCISNFDKIINPGGLIFILKGEWKSDEFLKTDLHLLDKHAEQIVFFEDWHYSLGCVEEFKLAFDKKIKMYECFQDHTSLWRRRIYVELNQAYIKSCFQKTVEFLKLCGIKKIDNESQINICEQFQNYISIYGGGRGE